MSDPVVLAMLQDLERQMDALERQEVVELSVESWRRTFALVSGLSILWGFGDYVGTTSNSVPMRTQETYRYM